MSTEQGSQARWHLSRVTERLNRLGTGPQRPLYELEQVRHAQTDLADVTDLLAQAARVDGASYAAIGRALQITRQAARERLIRYEVHQEQRAEDHAWRMTPRPRRRRLRWWRRRRDDAA